MGMHDHILQCILSSIMLLNTLLVHNCTCFICVYETAVSIDGLPSISSIKFKDHLNMAVGTATGQVLFHDIYIFILFYISQ